MKRLLLLIGIGLVLAGGIAWSNFRQARNLAIELAQVRAALARSAEARRLPALKKGAPEATPKEATKPAVQPAPKPRSFYELFVADPKLQSLWLAEHRAAAEARYGLLFRQLKLTPQQIGAFENSVARRDETQLDLGDIAKGQPAGWSDPAILGTLRQSEIECQQAQLAALGSDGFHQLQEYERTADVREWVGGIVGTGLLAGQDAVTPEQGERLVAAIAAANPDFGSGQRAALQPTDWDLVDSKVSAVLSPQQFEWFRSLEPGGGRFESQYQRSVTSALTGEKAKVVLVMP